MVRKVVGILLFIAPDRADIAHATKEIASVMKTPTDGHLARLKRFGRYLVNKKHYLVNLTADRRDRLLHRLRLGHGQD